MIIVHYGKKLLILNSFTEKRDLFSMVKTIKDRYNVMIMEII